MKIAVMGTGYVGLVTGTCFAEFGFPVTCVDVDAKKIQILEKGISPIYEPGLEDLIRKNTKAGRLKFSTDIPSAIEKATVVFIAVGTPQAEDGQADLKYVFSAAEQIAEHMDAYTVVVTKSTVPVDTNKKLATFLKEKAPHKEFDVVSNPEFLREGSAIEDFMRPDRVVVGCRSQRAEEVMRELYRPLSLLETPIVFTDPASAEIIKYAANSFLATKITFINQVADLCEKCDANVHDVSKGMGLDSRIGSKFLQTGPGYGGSCFPKDTLAMSHTAREYGAPLTIVDSVIKANDDRKKHMVEKIVHACGGSVKNKKIAILGLTFKPDTDDMRDAPSLTIIPGLQKAGARIQAYDPVGRENAQLYLKDVDWYEDAYGTLKEADALVILTEWNEFKFLDLERIKGLMNSPLMIDLRNIYRLSDMKKSGFIYHSLGRPLLRV
ncbi:MAG: UDP-glucose/GDP-mannose dehydrogenase family protein [Alphaproteobacteria bacterium]